MPTGTGRWGNIQWGASPSSAGSGLVLDIVNAYNDVLYRLGFAGARDIVSTSWVTAAELYQWADEAVKRLAYRVSLFITYDNSVSVAIGTAAYSLPASHVFVIAAALIYTNSLQLLRLTTAAELWALDGAWNATTGDPKRISLDAAAVGTATLYPKPLSIATLGLVLQKFPGTVSASSSTLSLPMVLQDYFSYRMLEGARGKESESAMPEMASHYRERCKMYEAVMEHLWGPGQ